MTPTFHHTLLQILGFDYQESIPSYHKAVSSYVKRKVAADLQGFTIRFTHMVVVTSGLILVGVPSIDLNIWRENLRTDLLFGGWPTKESNDVIGVSAGADIVHCTVFRLHSQPTPEQSKQLIEIADEVNAILASTAAYVSVRTLRLGAASWKMTTRELLKDTLCNTYYYTTSRLE